MNILENKSEFYFRKALHKDWEEVFTDDVKESFIKTMVKIRLRYTDNKLGATTPALVKALDCFNVFSPPQLQLVVVGRGFVNGNGLAFGGLSFNNTHEMMCELLNCNKTTLDITMNAWARQGVLMLPNSFTNHYLPPRNHKKMWQECLIKICTLIEKHYRPVWLIEDYPELSSKIISSKTLTMPKIAENNIVMLKQIDIFNRVNHTLLTNNKYAIQWKKNNP
jgi:uracil DNA glycosylase